MANPQLENGFLKIANEIWQALRKRRIPGESMQILMVIIEETYGWNRKKAMIQNKVFSEKTGIKKQNINRAISKLTELNMVKVIKKDYDIAPTYCLNKDYETWKEVIKKDYGNQKRLQRVIESDYEEVSKEITSTPSEPLPDKGCEIPKYTTKDTLKDNPPLNPPKRGRRLLSESEFIEKTKTAFEKMGQMRMFEPLKESLLDFYEMRKEIGKGLKSQKAISGMINNICEYSNLDFKVAQKIIQRSVANEWQGIFPLRFGTNGKPFETQQERLERRAAERMERLKERDKERLK